MKNFYNIFKGVNIEKDKTAMLNTPDSSISTIVTSDGSKVDIFGGLSIESTRCLSIELNKNSKKIYLLNSKSNSTIQVFPIFGFVDYNIIPTNMESTESMSDTKKINKKYISDKLKLKKIELSRALVAGKKDNEYTVNLEGITTVDAALDIKGTLSSTGLIYAKNSISITNGTNTDNKTNIKGNSIFNTKLNIEVLKILKNAISYATSNKFEKLKSDGTSSLQSTTTIGTDGNTGDILTINGNTTNNGTFTSTGLITGQNGLSISSGEITLGNKNSTTTNKGNFTVESGKLTTLKGSTVIGISGETNNNQMLNVYGKAGIEGVGSTLYILDSNTTTLDDVSALYIEGNSKFSFSNSSDNLYTIKNSNDDHTRLFKTNELKFKSMLQNGESIKIESSSATIKKINPDGGSGDFSFESLKLNGKKSTVNENTLKVTNLTVLKETVKNDPNDEDNFGLVIPYGRTLTVNKLTMLDTATNPNSRVVLKELTVDKKPFEIGTNNKEGKLQVGGSNSATSTYNNQTFKGKGVLSVTNLKFTPDNKNELNENIFTVKSFIKSKNSEDGPDGPINIIEYENSQSSIVFNDTVNVGTLKSDSNNEFTSKFADVTIDNADGLEISSNGSCEFTNFTVPSTDSNLNASSSKLTYTNANEGACVTVDTLSNVKLTKENIANLSTNVLKGEIIYENEDKETVGKIEISNSLETSTFKTNSLNITGSLETNNLSLSNKEFSVDLNQLEKINAPIVYDIYSKVFNDITVSLELKNKLFVKGSNGSLTISNSSETKDVNFTDINVSKRISIKELSDLHAYNTRTGQSVKTNSNTVVSAEKFNSNHWDERTPLRSATNTEKLKTGANSTLYKTANGTYNIDAIDIDEISDSNVAEYLGFGIKSSNGYEFIETDDIESCKIEIVDNVTKIYISGEFNEKTSI